MDRNELAALTTYVSDTAIKIKQLTQKYGSQTVVSKVNLLTTNNEGYLVTPEELKAGTYRIEEVKAPDGFVRQGNEMSLYDGEEMVSGLELSITGEYKENPKESITITVSCCGLLERA